jgi:ABC-type taurine transport system substrate-binding protein
MQGMVKATEFITESDQIDSNAVNELDIYIMNNEDLYRRQFMPIIKNLQRKIAKNVYDHEKAKKLWMYLIDQAAKEYVKEFGNPDEDVKDLFPKEIRNRVAEIIADRELENIKQGEYDVVKGTTS